MPARQPFPFGLMKFFRPCLLAAAIFTGLSGVPSTSRAQGGSTYYWQGGGGDNNVTNAANWSGGIAPPSDSNTSLVFSQEYFLGVEFLFPNLNRSQAVRGLTFAGGASFNLGRDGAYDLSIGIGGLTQNSKADQYITTPIRLTSLQSWSFGSNAGALIFKSDGAIDNQGNLLSVNTEGNSRLEGVISGSGGFAKTGGGTLTLTQPNAFTGTTTIQDGTLELNFGVNSTYAGAFGDSPGSSAATLLKSGAGRLTLSQASTFSGTTRITGGDVLLAHSAALQSSVVDLAKSNALTFGNGSTNYTLGGLTGSNDLALVSLNGTNVNLQIDTASAAGSTYSGVLSRGNDLVKTGPGAFTLAGANTYLGDTYIDGGFLGVGIDQALSRGAIRFRGGVLLGVADVTLANSPRNESGAPITVAAVPGATLKLTGGLNMSVVSDSLRFGSAGQTGTVVAAFSGATYNIPNGASGTNPKVFLDFGALQAGGAFSFNSSDFTMAAGTVLDLANEHFTLLNLYGSGSVNASVPGPNSLLTVAGGDYNGILSGAISLEKANNRLDAFFSSTNTLILRGASSFTGATTLNAGTLQLANDLPLQNSTVIINTANGLAFSSNIGTFKIGGLSGGANQTLNDVNSAGITLQVGGNGADTTYSGVLSGAGRLVKVGAGVLTLTNANVYSGATFINAGVLAVSNDHALSNGDVNMQDTELRGVANTTVSNKILTADYLTAVISAAPGTTLTLKGQLYPANFTAGTVGNGGGVTFGSPGQTGTVVYSETIFYSPTSFRYTVAAGTLRINNADFNFGAGASREPFTVSAGATLDLNATTLAQGGLYNLQGGGIITNTNIDASALTMRAGDFSGSIQGLVNLTKVASGTMTLSGANSYSGPTSVNAGTLLVNGANSGAGAVTVSNAGAVLGGAGTVAAGVTLNAGARLNPGGNSGANGSAANVGALRTGALTLASPEAGLIFDVNSAALYDRLLVSGNVSLGGGALTINLNPSASFTNGQTLALIHLTSGTLDGEFAGIADGGAYSFGASQIFRASYTDSDFTLTAVPEPATWLAGALLTVVALLGVNQARRPRPC